MVGSLFLSLRGLAVSDGIADSVVGEEPTQSHGVRSVSHTWDSDVSPLINRDGGATNLVTIIRGETKAGGGGGGTNSVNVTPSAPTATPNQGASPPARTTSAQ